MHCNRCGIATKAPDKIKNGEFLYKIKTEDGSVIGSTGPNDSAGKGYQAIESVYCIEFMDNDPSMYSVKPISK